MYTQDARVKFHGVPKMSHMTGRIKGLGMGQPNPLMKGWAAYIVEIDPEFHDDLKELGYEYTTILMTDACIERYGKND